MARRIAALKPQLNRIRAWAHEGSTDAWIAHQLETTAESVRAFRQEHGIERGGPAPLAPITPDSVVEAMLAEEAAALEAGPEPELTAEGAEATGSARAPVRAPRRRARKAPVAEVSANGAEAEGAAAEGAAVDEVVAAPARSTRRRTARGGAGRSATAEAAVAEPEAHAETGEEDDHAGTGSGEASGEAPAADEHARAPRKRGRRRGRGRGARGLEARLLPGSVLLLDPSVTADATFQEHWQAGGPLRVEVSADAIVLRRVPSGDADHER